MNIDELNENIKAYNRHANKEFVKQINRYFENPTATHSVLSLGETPLILRLCGANGDRVVIPVSIINDKCVAKIKTKKHPHPHNLSKNLMRSLPSLIRTPVMVFKGSHPNTLAIICNATDRKKDFILVSCMLNTNGRNTRINNVITSAYGKEKIQNYIKNHESDLIAYNSQFQKEKTGENSYDTLRLQLPLGRNIICFDNSISYSLRNVKGLDEIFLENIKENLVQRYPATSGREKEVLQMDENKMSAIIKESVREATEPVVKRVDEVAGELTTLVKKVKEQDNLINGLLADNGDKSQLINDQRDIISEQQSTIEDLQAKLDAALSENRKLKEEKAITTELLENVEQKLIIAVPKFERMDYGSQLEEIAALFDMVEFVPQSEVNEQRIENSELKDELSETKATLSEIKDKLMTIQRENDELRKDIDRLNSRTEIVKSVELDTRTEPTESHEFDISQLEQEESAYPVDISR